MLSVLQGEKKMYRVLVVDDEQIIRDGLERLLNKIPYVNVVGTMKDGIHAKKYIENQWVDAIFTDIRMSVMDGLELARYIAAYKPDCKIVIISAYCEFHYAQQAMACGVKHYLMKPIRFAEVKRVVEQLVEERTARERSMLWNHDFKKEIQELELYHTLINVSNPAELRLKKKLYYAEYEVLINNTEYEKMNYNIEILRACWTNIMRWCAPMCIPVLSVHEKRIFRYTLLAEDIEQFPKVEDLKERANLLMEIQAEIFMNHCADVKELIQNSPKSIVQDEITDCVILEAKKYIARNFSQNISRTDVAEAVHLEPSYFSKYFRKKCGMNFHDYLQRERIRKVIELLDKGYKVFDAANMAGFQNRNHFNQVFKQHIGCSPSDYKKGKNKELKWQEDVE